MSPLIPAEQRQLMLVNAERSASDPAHDPQPVVMLKAIGSRVSWLLSELDPEDGDTVFGLSDLAPGAPTLGRWRLSDIAQFCPRHEALPGHLFTPKAPLSAYALAASRVGYVTEIFGAAA